MNFQVGDKVTALNVESSIYLQLKAIYTIKKIDTLSVSYSRAPKTWFYLEEVPNHWFEVSRFVKCTQKQEMMI
jgi:hypothetical protein